MNGQRGGKGLAAKLRFTSGIAVRHGRKSKQTEQKSATVDEAISQLTGRVAKLRAVADRVLPRATPDKATPAVTPLTDSERAAYQAALRKINANPAAPTAITKAKAQSSALVAPRVSLGGSMCTPYERDRLRDASQPGRQLPIRHTNELTYQPWPYGSKRVTPKPVAD